MQQYQLKKKDIVVADDQLKEYPELLAGLLRSRGIATSEAAHNFLNPDYDRDTHHSFRMKDMEKAARRVLKAIEENQKIVIYSDYDADGIPAAVVLHDVFKKIGFDNFSNYIPHRTDEGFGLNIDAVKEFIKNKVDLIITIDCGIMDVEPVKLAQNNKSKKIDVIITDHHEPGSVIPNAYAIVNPKQEDCQYPEKVLCGAGVIYKFIQALIYVCRERGMIAKLPIGFEKWLLDMVGIATLSDMVPLTGENRIFAFYGLKVLRISPRIGLMHLLKKTNTTQRYISEDDVGFMISPRINAASRMGIPHDAFKLLSTKDIVEAGALSEHLNKINDERKGLVASMVKDIKKTLSQRSPEQVAASKVICIGNPDWKPSLCGLAANALKEEFGGAAFVWGRETGKEIKGSCRSDGTVSVVKLMQSIQEELLHFGGHEMSGGFAVSHEKIHTLQDKLREAYDKLLSVLENNPDSSLNNPKVTTIDAKIQISDVNWKTYSLIEKMGPFGVGNPKPLFLFERVFVRNKKMFGKQKNHVELEFQNEKIEGNAVISKAQVKGIAFFASAEFLEKVPLDQPINLVATFEKSYFRNEASLRLRIVDVII
jgi:single-stranded-DNA-specific exonuclease